MKSLEQDKSSDHSDVWWRIKKGDQEALGKVFHNYYNELYYYGIKIIPDEEKVKDAIQDLFVVIGERGAKLGEVENIKAYLLSSLRRKLLKNPKRQFLIFTDSTGIEKEFAFSPEDFMVHQEQAKTFSRQLNHCFSQLTPRQREVVFLRFYHELPLSEIANVLNMNIQSARNLLFRALSKLRKLILAESITEWGNLELFLLSVFSNLKK